MTEITISSYTFCLDFCHHTTTDVFLGYVKSTFKSEFVLLDANDYFEPSGLNIRDKISEDEKNKQIYLNIGNSIKAKIDQELHAKYEQKRKYLAQLEKSKGKNSSNLSRKSVFSSICDVVFCIINFPYCSQQYNAMKEAGIEISSFIFITDGLNNIPTSTVQTSSPTKKLCIPQTTSFAGKYVSSDFIPVRWLLLQDFVESYVLFAKIIVVSDENSVIYDKLKNHINTYIVEKSEYKSKTDKIKLISLPYKRKDKFSIDYYRHYIKYDRNNYSNSLYAQLKLHDFQLVPPVAKRKLHKYIQIFDKMKYEINFQKFKEVPLLTTFFPNRDIYASFEYTSQLFRWVLPKDQSSFISKSYQLLTKIENYYAYCGSKFDMLVTDCNKKFSLGLSNAYFDFTKWNLMYEHKDFRRDLSDAISRSIIVNSRFDELTGNLFILCIPPVQKQMGKPILNTFMPSTLDGITNWLKMPEPESIDKSKKNYSSILNYIRNKIHPSSLFQDYKDALSQTKVAYSLPCHLSCIQEYTSPYFMGNIMFFIKRRVLISEYLFCFVILGERFRISCEQSSLSLIFDVFKTNILETGEICFFYDENYSFIVNNDEFIYINGERKSKFLFDGTFCFNVNNNQYIIRPDGFVGHFNGEEWLWTDSRGILIKNGVLSETKIFNKINPCRKQIIREDNVRYSIHEGGNKTIEVENVFSVVVKKDQIFYHICGFPEIMYENGTYKCVIYNDTFEISQNLVQIISNNHNFAVSKDNIRINISSDEETIVTTNSILARYGRQCFISNNLGVERLSTLTSDDPPAKMLKDYIKTDWGYLVPTKDVLQENTHLDLSQRFPSYFFVVRSDNTATQFFYNVDNHMKYQIRRKVTEFNGENVELVTYMNGPKAIQTFYSPQPVDKTRKTAIVKLFAPPKSKALKKGEKAIDPEQAYQMAREARKHYDNFFNDLFEFSSKGRKEAEIEYEIENSPPQAPVDDIGKIPPFTPSPRHLIAQSFKSYSFLKPYEVNYWESPEAIFVKLPVVVTHKPRPPSPRTKLFDPPREPSNEKDAPPEFSPRMPNMPRIDIEAAPRRANNKSIFQTLQTKSMFSSPPSTARDMGRCISFGDIPVNKRTYASMQITNTGNKPLKYTCFQPLHDAVKVHNPPGVVYPGLKLTLKLSILSNTPGKIETSFRFLTQLFENEIAIFANIVQNEEEQ